MGVGGWCNQSLPRTPALIAPHAAPQRVTNAATGPSSVNGCNSARAFSVNPVRPIPRYSPSEIFRTSSNIV